VNALGRLRLTGLLALALALAVALAVSASGTALGAPLGQISDFLTPTMNSQPEGIVAGPDGNLWFTEFSGNKIAEVNPSTHGIAEFSVPTGMSQPLGVALGPDGDIWFTEWAANKIAEINPATHAINQFTIPTANSFPVAITEGADGNMWFTEQAGNKVAEISPVTHAFNEFPVTTAASQPFGIAAGPDGNIWFTEKAASQIGVISLSTHTITEVKTPTPAAMPNAIAAGPDGNLWFTEMATGVKGIGEINPLSKLPVEFQTPTANALPTVITTGPDGNMWFTENAVPSKVGFINPFTHTFGTEFATPTPNSGPVGIATGADGNLWFTEHDAGRIGVVGAGAPAPLVLAPTLAGTPQPGGTLACRPATFASYAGLQPSANAFGFDGFRWLLDGSQIAGAASQSFTVPSADVGHQLSCAETVTYPLVGPTTTASSAPVAVSPSLGASLARTSSSGSTLSVTIACQGLPSQSCAGPVKLTTRVTTRGSQTLAVAAKAKPKPKPKPKKVTKTVTVASGSYLVAAGHSTTITLRLNSAGQRLLNQFYRLPAALAIGGPTAITKSVTFSYAVVHSPISFTWTFTASFTVERSLSISNVPSGGKVAVSCHGGGCPFGSRTFKPTRGKVVLTSALSRSHLRPHATVRLDITATNEVGKVAIFTVRSGQQPSLTESCLPPGARTPSRCV
jgi:streptogramin lyase